MRTFTVCIERTQYTTIEVEAEDEQDALEKANDYYDEHFEEVDRELDGCVDCSYEQFIV